MLELIGKSCQLVAVAVSSCWLLTALCPRTDRKAESPKKFGGWVDGDSTTFSAHFRLYRAFKNCKIVKTLIFITKF